LQNHKVNILLHTLSTTARKQFARFIASRYHNKERNLEKLYDYLCATTPDEQSDTAAYDAVYGINEEPNLIKHKQIVKLLSKVNTILEDFIVVESLTRDTVLADIILLEYLMDHQLVYRYQGLLSKVQDTLDKRPIINENHFYQRATIESIIVSDTSITLDKGKQQADILSLSPALDEYYLVEKLIQACLAKNRQMLNPIEFDFEFIDILISHIKPHDTQQSWYITLWIKMYQLLSQPSIIGYKDTKALFLTYLHQIDQLQKTNIFVYLENVSRMLLGLEERFREAFALAQLQMQEGTILVNSIIVPGHYRNIIGIGVYTGHIDEVKEFITSYKQYLPEFADRADLIHLCDAIYLFGSAQYDACLDKLNLCTPTNLQWKMDERRWRIKANYELGNQTQVLDLVKNFRNFLSEHSTELSDIIIQQNRNLLSYVVKLQTAHTLSKKQLQDTLLEIQQENTLAEKLWLINKASHT
jgi:hypothetical protein